MGKRSIILIVLVDSDSTHQDLSSVQKCSLVWLLDLDRVQSQLQPVQTAPSTSTGLNCMKLVQIGLVIVTQPIYMRRPISTSQDWLGTVKPLKTHTSENP